VAEHACKHVHYAADTSLLQSGGGEANGERGAEDAADQGRQLLKAGPVSVS